MDEEVQSSQYIDLFKAEKILEKNWEIDLADRLTRYLAHLDSIDGGVSRKNRKRTHDEVADSDDEEEGSGEESGGEVDEEDFYADRPRINFAEAAAVIQGCAEIYSKKVDYLYQRTMKFQTVVDARQETIAKKVGRKERIDEFRRKIKTIADRECQILDFDLLEYSKRKPLRSAAKSTEKDWDTRQESGKRKTGLLTKLLMEFVPLRPDEKRELSIHCGSKNQDIFGNADDFKVNRFVPGICGAMILRMQNEALMSEFTDPNRYVYEDSAECSSVNDGGIVDPYPEIENQEPYSAGPTSCGFQSQAASCTGSTAVEFVRAGTACGNRISQPAHVRPSLLNMTPLCSEAYIDDISMGDVLGASQAGNFVENAPSRRCRSTSLLQRMGAFDETAASLHEANMRDVASLYVYSNALEDVKVKRRAQKVGKTYIPADKERDRRDALIKKIAEEGRMEDTPWSLTNFIQEMARDSRSLEKKSLRLADRAPYLADPIIVSLQKCVSKETKRRQARRKALEEMHVKWLRENGELHQPNNTVIPEVENSEPEEAEAGQVEECPPTPSQALSTQPTDIPSASCVPENDNFDMFDLAAPDQDIQNAADEQMAKEYSHLFVDPVDRESPSDNEFFGDLEGTANNADHDGVLHGNLFSAEEDDDNLADFDFLGDPNDPFLVLKKPLQELSVGELVRYRVHEFWQIPKDHMTKLMVRVQDWEEKMVPLLDEELERREFKIHDYGSEILDKFENLGEQRNFVDMFKGIERHEVSRYFLSALMLTNTYNVKTEDDTATLGLEGAVNTMKLELLKERHHECFEASGDFVQGNFHE
uniref:CNDH2_C domain-containing protein n=1 Tax=Steinernema glaseri TaxID=37863 RepID=A0A1I7YZB9_9BILA